MQRFSVNASLCNWLCINLFNSFETAINPLNGRKLTTANYASYASSTTYILFSWFFITSACILQDLFI
jgi:hypothetical protein